MEDSSPISEIFAAIDARDDVRLMEILTSDPVEPFLGEGEHNVIIYAHERTKTPHVKSQQEYDQARRILFRLLAALATARQTGAIPEDIHLTPTTMLIRAIEIGDTELAEKLLEAGADPNGYLPETGNTPLIVALYNNRAPVVLSLLRYGADPETLATEDRDPFQYAVSQGRQEIAWTILLFEALGDAPPDLLQAFKAGNPDGSMEEAVAQLNLDEENMLHLWRALIGKRLGRAAAAVLTGYCQGTGTPPDDDSITLLLNEQLDQNLNRCYGTALGDIIYGLDQAGFSIDVLTAVKQDRALCKAIGRGSEDRALDLLVEFNVAPLVLPVNDEYLNYKCPALTMALEQDMAAAASAIFNMDILPISLSITTLQNVIERDNRHLLNCCLAAIELPYIMSIKLLEFAVVQDRAACLAILIAHGCDPAHNIRYRSINAQNYGQNLLSKACSTTNVTIPAPEDRFDCALTLLLAMTGGEDQLYTLCDFIILGRGETGDYPAVFFLCSLGFIPQRLLEQLAEVWVDDDVADERKQRLACAAHYACEGLASYIYAVLEFNVQSFASEALDDLLPGAAQCSGVFSVDDFVVWAQQNGDIIDGLDIALLEGLLSIPEGALAYLPELGQAIDILRAQLDRLFERHSSVPTLMELSGEAVLDTLTPENSELYRQRLPDFVWQGLLTRDRSYSHTPYQFIILDLLREHPDLAQLTFGDNPYYLAFYKTDSSEEPPSHDGSSSFSDSSD